MIKVNIQSNVDIVKRELDVARGDLQIATARAINKVAITARAESAREIQEVYNIKIAAIKGRIDLKRATVRMPEAELRASGKPLPLLAFAGTRQNKVGVGVKIKVAGGRKTIAHAFITTTKAGVKAAFIRRGKARYPLKFLRSVGIEQTFSSKVVTDALKKLVTERFPIVYRGELKFALDKSALVVK